VATKLVNKSFTHSNECNFSEWKKVKNTCATHVCLLFFIQRCENVVLEHYHLNKGNVKGTSSTSYFQENLLSFINFTITTQVIIIKLCKE
jgi:hypothetical protein